MLSSNKNKVSIPITVTLAFLGILLVLGYFFLVSKSPLVDFLTPRVPTQEVHFAARTFFKELPVKHSAAQKHIKVNLDHNLLKYVQFFRVQNQKFPNLSVGYWDIYWTDNENTHENDDHILFRVKYDFSGNLIGFSIRDNALPKEEDKNLNESEAIHEAKFFLESQDIKTDSLVISNKDISKKDKSVKYRINFKNNLRQYPGLQDTYTVELTGNKISFFDHQKKYDPSITGDLSRDETQGLALILQIIAWIAVIFVIIVHFIRRLRNDELEFKRALGIGAAAGAIAFSAIVFRMSGNLMEILLFGGTLALLSAVSFLVIFPVSEAHCRDVWPDKLALTDLLFRGKGWLREIGIAILRSFFLVGIIVFFVGALIFLTTTFNLGSITFNANALSIFMDMPLALFTLQKNLLLSLLAGFVFLAFWPAYLTIRVGNTPLTIFLLILTFNIAGLYTLFFQPSYLAFVLLSPLALGYTIIALKYDILTVLLVFLGVNLFLDLALVLVIPGTIFGFTGMVGIIIYFLFFLLGIYMSFCRRSAQDYDYYVPSYVGRIAEKEKFLKELEIARNVQMRFLPQTVPISPYLEISSLCRPAMEVGGDYYDFIQVNPRRMVILIGDVSGKGVSAAFYMTMIKGIIKTLAKKINEPAQLLIEANEIFYENAPRDTFITIIYGVFDSDVGTLTFASAGHNPLILWKNDPGSTDVYNPRGIALGFRPSQTYRHIIEEKTISLEEGDLFVFYTDGVTEAMNANLEIFGEQRLRTVVAKYNHLPPGQLEQRIVESVSQFTGDAPQHDDFTMVIVKIKRKPQS